VHAREFAFLGFSEVKVRKIFPDRNRTVSHQWLFDFAEPAHELGQQATRQSVGQQEVQVFLIEQVLDLMTQANPH
jgi:hypothetical protein